jgi:hypothetical protein
VDKLKSPERPKTEDEKAEEKKKDEEKQKELAEIEIKDGDYQVQCCVLVCCVVHGKTYGAVCCGVREGCVLVCVLVFVVSSTARWHSRLKFLEAFDDSCQVWKYRAYRACYCTESTAHQSKGQYLKPQGNGALSN